MSDEPSLLQAPPCPGGTLYTIRPGDSYFTLAPRFNTTVEALIAANPGVSPTNLQIGQTICIPVAPAPGPCPGGFTYQIRAGDTFFSLARRFGIAVAALEAANPGVDPTRLRIGQSICIPAPPTACPGGMMYEIRPGDTFFSIGRRFGVSPQELIDANPGVDPNRLRIGQRICIPRVPERVCPAGTFSYTIQSGDTFFSLARRFNTTVQSIQALNPGVDPNRLRVGQVICIPREA